MTWAHYLLQVNIYLVLFYTFYKLLLDKETYFMLNRMYLLVSGVLSLAIPFLRPEWFVKQPVTQQIKISVDQLNMMIAQVAVSPDEAEPFNWGQLAGGIYVCGVIIFLFRFIFQLVAVKKLIENKPAGAAFSFFHKKVIDNNLPGLETIYQHEEIHSRQLHTLDVLFFELLAILVWCNPIVYFYKKTVKNIHEYLADEEAAQFQGDKESYAILLLSKAFGIDQNVLTNSFFNKSLIKKRIFMLHKERSKKTAILKYGLFLPLFAVTLLFSSATISQNKEIIAVAEQFTTPEISIPAPPADDAAAGKAKRADSWTAFYKHLSRTIRYPLSAHENELQGNSLVKFTISNGEISGVSVVAPLGLGCDAEVMKNILSFDDFKQVKDGKYALKVAFRIPDVNTAIKNQSVSSPSGYTSLKEVTVTSFNRRSAGKTENFTEMTVLPENLSGTVTNVQITSGTTKNKVFDFVSIDKQPVFPGGMTAFYKYLADNCKFPAEASAKKINGKVFMSFIVEANGELADIQVVRALGYGTDEEAIRLLKNSPKWEPGILNGRPVRVKYNIPINFSTTEDKPKKVMIIGTGNPVKQPMYVLDGKTISTEEMKDVDPNDIQAIHVLNAKNAAVTYGGLAKNGAVIITTKQASKTPVVSIKTD
jgi:TonB family protein